MNTPKFRAWDKASKKMIYKGFFIEDGEVCAYEPYDPSNLIVMQSTGLKDDENNDIYHGDIVDVKFGCISVVAFGHYEASADWSCCCDDGAYGEVDVDAYGWFFKSAGGTDVTPARAGGKVIGNIYEVEDID